jgi:rubrerythrin
MPRQYSRRAALGAAAGLAAATALPGLGRAAVAPDADLAALRLLIAAELLAIDFYAHAAMRGDERPTARAALGDERAHYDALARLLVSFGGAPATAADIDFSYPRATATAQALRIERLLAGSYVGAAATMQTPSLRLAVAQIAATEAQHVAAWLRLEGRGPFGPTFAPALSLEQASDELGAFTS